MATTKVFLGLCLVASTVVALPGRRPPAGYGPQPLHTLPPHPHTNHQDPHTNHHDPRTLPLSQHTRSQKRRRACHLTLLTMLKITTRVLTSTITPTLTAKL